MFRDIRKELIDDGLWDPDKYSKRSAGRKNNPRTRARYRRLNRVAIAESKVKYRTDNRERINRQERERRQKVRLEKKPGTK